VETAYGGMKDQFLFFREVDSVAKSLARWTEHDMYRISTTPRMTRWKLRWPGQYLLEVGCGIRVGECGEITRMKTIIDAVSNYKTRG